MKLSTINFRDRKIRRGCHRLWVIVSCTVWIARFAFMLWKSSAYSGFRGPSEFEVLLAPIFIAIGVYISGIGLYWGTHWILQGFRSKSVPQAEVRYLLHAIDYSMYTPSVLHISRFPANTDNNHEEAKTIALRELESLVPRSQWKNK